jgi:hypothetical protein
MCPSSGTQGTATYLKGDGRNEGTPVGRLRTLVQQGLDLWEAEMRQNHKDAEPTTWAFSVQRTTEKPRGAAEPP